MPTPAVPQQPMDTAYMALIEAQADRAMPTQLRVWVEKLRAHARARPGSQAEHASALMLKLEHLFADKSVAVATEIRPGRR